VRLVVNTTGTRPTNVQVKGKSETNALPTSRYRPSAFVRFPAEKSTVAGNNVALSNRVYADEMRNPINVSVITAPLPRTNLR
jgi:hypothetical protein